MKVRSLWPMPSGSGNYLTAVRTFLALASDGPTVDDFLASMRSEYPSVGSDKAARAYAHVVIDLGLMEFDRGFVRVSEAGATFLETQNRCCVLQALTDRIAGVPELLREIGDDPDRIGLLAERMRGRGFDWKNYNQIRYRLRWLEEVGVVTRVGRGRPVYYLTDWAPR